MSRPSRPNGSRPPAQNPTNPALVGRAPIPAGPAAFRRRRDEPLVDRAESAGHSRPDGGHRAVRCRRILADRPRAQHGRRQRAHRRPPRPLRPAGPSHPVIPAVRRPAGHLDHHPGHRLSGRTGGGEVPAAGAGPARPARRRRRWRRAGRSAADRDVPVDGVRRTGAEEPGALAAGAHGPRHRRTAAAVLEGLHARHQRDQRDRQLDPAPDGHRTRRGAAPPRAPPPNWCRWCETRREGGRWTRTRPCWWTGHCSSANAPPRS